MKSIRWKTKSCHIGKQDEIYKVKDGRLPFGSCLFSLSNPGTVSSYPFPPHTPLLAWWSGLCWTFVESKMRQPVQLAEDPPLFLKCIKKLTYAEFLFSLRALQLILWAYRPPSPLKKEQQKREKCRNTAVICTTTTKKEDKE